MHRSGRRSPSPRGVPRSRYAQEENRHDAHESLLPGLLAPSFTLQPQAIASRHCFAAAATGTLLSISGGSLFESTESHQQIQLGPRPRPLTCMAGSPCGRWWAIGESCFGGRSGQVIVMSSESKDVVSTMSLGVRRCARYLCWAAQGELVAAIVEFESEHSTSAEQQLMVWSWPSGERLATSTCGRGTQDIAGSPDEAVLLTVGPYGAKVWTLVRSHDSITGRAAGGIKLSCGGGLLPLRLLGRSLPIGPVGPTALAACSRLVGTATAGRRRPAEDSLVAVAFGVESALFLATKHGGLGVTFCESTSKAPLWRDLGKRIAALRWARRLLGAAPPGGVLACALAGGIVDVLAASSMTTVFKLDAGSSTRPDAVGVATNPLMDGLWVLYSDRSLSFFSDSAAAAWTLPGAVCDLRGSYTLPGNILTRVVSYSSWSVQLWTRPLHGDLRLEVQTEPAAAQGCELTALAVSPWVVACGHANGEVRLLAALHGLGELGLMPSKHAAEVLGLSFGHWKPASLRPVLLASVSQDRSALVFSIELQQSSTGIESSRASLLLHLQHHSSPVQHVALLTAPSSSPMGSEIFRVVVCTSDQLIWREAESTESLASVHKCARQQAARGSRWVGVCNDAARGCFYAACSNRRVVQLDQAGRRTEEVVIGGSNVEIVGPIQLSNDGRFLAAILKGAAGVLLFAVGGCLQPLARLAAGQADPPRGVSFLPGDQMIACWTNGTLLGWKAPDTQIARAAGSHEQVQAVQGEAVRRAISPREAGVGVIARATKLRPASGSPPRGRRSARGPLRSSSSALAPRKPIPLSARGAVTSQQGQHWPKTSRPSLGEERMRKDPIKSNIQAQAQATQSVREKDSRAKRLPEGLRELRRLLASSPSPPRWAEAEASAEASIEKSSLLCGDSEKEEPGPKEPKPKPPNPQVTQPTELGKWARGSLVGAQVRSASDLHRVGPRDELEQEVQVRCASEGAQGRCRGVLKRRLFIQPLPPKPVFPPPDQGDQGPVSDQHPLEVSAISSAHCAGIERRRSTESCVESVDSRKGPRALPAPALPIFLLPTPCRGRQDQLPLKSPSSELEDLVDTVVTLKTRLSAIQPDRLPTQEANLLLEPLQRFELMLRSQMKSRQAT